MRSWAGQRGLSLLPIVRTEAQRERSPTKPCLLFKDLTAKKLLDLGWGEASLVHLAGSSRDDQDQSIWDSTVGTTRVVAGVAQGARLERIVYLSGYGVAANSTEPYFRAKSRAEHLIQATGIPNTILRASYILGPGDELTPQLVAQLRRGRVEVPGSGLYRIQPLHVADVVTILLAAAADRSADSQILPLLGEPIAYIDLVKSLAMRVAPTAEILPVELEQFIRRMLLSPDPDFTISELCVLICDRVGPSTRNCFGKTLPDLNSVIERIAAQYIEG